MKIGAMGKVEPGVDSGSAKNTRVERLLAVIPTGQENARSMQELSEVLGIEPRTLRQLIVDAAEEGNLIAGDSHGYYLPSNTEEVKGFYNLMATRQKTTDIRMKPFRRALKGCGDDATKEEV